jgi:hypothetical protein
MANKFIRSRGSCTRAGQSGLGDDHRLTHRRTTVRGAADPQVCQQIPCLGRHSAHRNVD